MVFEAIACISFLQDFDSYYPSNIAVRLDFCLSRFTDDDDDYVRWHVSHMFNESQLMC